MSERLKVSDREIEFAADFACGSTPADIAKQNLRLPENVEGLVIVDVAAGLSSLVPVLLQEGADAYAVDPIYGVSTEELDELIDSTVYSTLDYVPHIFRWDMKYILDQSTSEFRMSYEAFTERYKKGYATKLPFPDNFADYVTSMNGIAGLLMNDPELFINALKEALRVVKPGGKVIISPWFADHIWGEDACKVHAQVLEELLRDENIKSEVETGYIIETQVPIDPGSRLILTKLN